MKTDQLSIPVSATIGAVSGEFVEPSGMTAFMTLAHGAGAGMHHGFMKALSKELASRGIGTLRFNFPYMEKKKGRPDPPAIAEKTISSAVDVAHRLYPELPLLCGGKSFGGRMTSQLFSRSVFPAVKGLVFFGFPLHAPGKPSTDRAAHLSAVSLPMLFLQGTRDTLADLALITQVTSTLPTASLKIIEGADHSFAAGRKQLIPELAEATAAWAAAF